MLKQLIEELSGELEFPIPKPNDKGIYEVEIVPGVLLALKDIEPGVFIDARLEECPKEKREDLFISIMQANLLGQGTGGAVIGLQRDEKYLTLSLALSYELNYRAFKENLEDFVNYLLYWREQIQKAKEEAQKLI